MIFHGKTPKRLLDVLLAGISAQAEDVVVIALGHSRNRSVVGKNNDQHAAVEKETARGRSAPTRRSPGWSGARALGPSSRLTLVLLDLLKLGIDDIIGIGLGASTSRASSLTSGAGGSTLILGIESLSHLTRCLTQGLGQ